MDRDEREVLQKALTRVGERLPNLHKAHMYLANEASATINALADRVEHLGAESKEVVDMGTKGCVRGDVYINGEKVGRINREVKFSVSPDSVVKVDSNGKLLYDESRLNDLRDVHKIQGSDGNWNCDEYMLGMFNGLELALALMEGREPEFRSLVDDPPTINEDELVGYIMRTVADEGVFISYESLRAILDAELDYLIEQGIAEEE